MSSLTRKHSHTVVILVVVMLVGAIGMGTAGAVTAVNNDGLETTSNAVTTDASTTTTATSVRSFDDADVGPGDSMLVTVEANLDSAQDFSIVEQFDPAFGSAQLIDDDGANFSRVRSTNGQVFATYADRATATLTYEVTVDDYPTAQYGDTYAISGYVRSHSAGSNSSTGGDEVVDVSIESFAPEHADGVRTIGTQDLSAGGTTQVTVDVTLDTTRNFTVVEEVDAAFSSVTLVNADGADYAGVRGGDGVYATYTNRNAVSLTYEVAADSNGTYTFDGIVNNDMPKGTIDAATTGDGSISVGGSASAPSAPSNLSVTGTTESSAALDWEAPSDTGSSALSHYNVYVDGTFDQQVAAGTTSATVTGLASNTTYDFTVTAVNDDTLESSPSNTATATTDPSTTAPSAPSNLAVTGTTDSSVDLSWDAPSDTGSSALSHYNVYVDGAFDQQVAAGTTSTTASGLSASTAYDFHVTAVNDDGLESDPSNTVTATTDSASNAPVPSVDSFTENQNNNPHAYFQVDWSASDADGDLDTVEVSVTNTDTGGTLDTITYDVSGASASGSHEFKEKKADGAGNTYEAQVVATDVSGNTTTVTATLTEGP